MRFEPMATLDTAVYKAQDPTLQSHVTRSLFPKLPFWITDRGRHGSDDEPWLERRSEQDRSRGEAELPALATQLQQDLFPLFPWQYGWP